MPHDGLLAPVLKCGSGKTVWGEKGGSMIRGLMMDELMGLLGVIITNSMPDARVREL